MRFLIVVFVGFLFTACQSKRDVKINYNGATSIEQIIQKELASGERSDTLFLDYQFGMTEEEFYHHTQKLLNEDKIYEGEDGLLTYSLFTRQDSLLLTWSPKYYNEKLYELGISSRRPPLYDKYGESSMNAEISYLTLSSMLMNRFSLPDFEEENYGECGRKVWIENNRQIKLICGIDDARFFYIDLSVQQNIENEKSVKQKERHKESISDF